MREVEFGGPLHSLVIAGEMHELEEKMLRTYFDVDVVGKAVEEEEEEGG